MGSWNVFHPVFSFLAPFFLFGSIRGLVFFFESPLAARSFSLRDDLCYRRSGLMPNGSPAPLWASGLSPERLPLRPARQGGQKARDPDRIYGLFFKQVGLTHLRSIGGREIVMWGLQYDSRRSKEQRLPPRDHCPFLPRSDRRRG